MSEPCPGPIRIGPQFIFWCDTCESRDVDDDTFDARHAAAEYTCFPSAPDRCVWKCHAGRACTAPIVDRDIKPKTPLPSLSAGKVTP